MQSKKNSKTKQEPKLHEVALVKPISKDYLNQLLTSAKLVSQISIALKISEDTGKEAGFEISKDIATNITHMGEVRTGTQSKLNASNSPNEHQKFARRLFPNKIFFCLGSLHTHPIDDINLFIIPSSPTDGYNTSDLFQDNFRAEVNRQNFGYNLPPISMIAQQRENRVRILAYQAETSRPTSEKEFLELAHNITEELDMTDSNEDVVDVLKSFGYKAMILRARPNGEIFRQDALKFAV
jgi:hypothetical protein